MENRKPFQLRGILIVYNFIQVLFSTWLFYEAYATGWFNGYSFRCQPVDYSRSPLAMRVGFFFIFCLKIIYQNFLFHFYFRWHPVVGGITFQNSQNFSIQYSL